MVNAQDDTDRRLREALRKPPTADNLNAVGDLYLKKGEHGTANHYFHKAVSLLNFAQKDKIIAIYKKIITHSPEDVKAYEGLLKILLRIGFVVDELKYLTTLARIYEEQGDMDKAYHAYRRLSELNPQSMHARDFLSKWSAKPAVNERWSREEPEDIPKSSEQSEEQVSQDASATVRDQADRGLFSVTLDEAETPVIRRKPAPKASPAVPRQKLIIGAVAVAVLVFLLAGGIFLFKYIRGQDASDREPGIAKKSFSGSIQEVQAGDYHVSVMKASGDFLKENDAEQHLTRDDMNGNVFYAVTVQPQKSCLPGAFVDAPDRMVSLLDRGGSQVEPGNLRGVDKLSRVIYRSNICNRDFGAVFLRFFVYHKKDFELSELIVDGLETAAPVRIPWDRR